MREPPAGFDVAAVAAALRTHWGYDAATVEHLPVGFGAHHWRADDALFVTLDVPGPHHDAPRWRTRTPPPRRWTSTWWWPVGRPAPGRTRCRSVRAG